GSVVRVGEEFGGGLDDAELVAQLLAELAGEPSHPLFGPGLGRGIDRADGPEKRAEHGGLSLQVRGCRRNAILPPPAGRTAGAAGPCARPGRWSPAAGSPSAGRRPPPA